MTATRKFSANGTLLALLCVMVMGLAMYMASAKIREQIRDVRDAVDGAVAEMDAVERALSGESDASVEELGQAVLDAASANDDAVDAAVASGSVANNPAATQEDIDFATALADLAAAAASRAARLVEGFILNR